MALPKTAAMPPPGMMDAAPPKAPAAGPKKPDAPPADDASGAKASVADAHVVRSDQHCKDCSNYTPESGDCSKVDGSFDPEDSCVRFFESLGGDEPDADEAGGPPDSDSDDMMGAPGGMPDGR